MTKAEISGRRNSGKLRTTVPLRNRANKDRRAGKEPSTSRTVTGPTIGDELLIAKVHYVGREVSTATNAAAIVATFDNPCGTLRARKFVQVRVPVVEQPSRKSPLASPL